MASKDDEKMKSAKDKDETESKPAPFNKRESVVEVLGLGVAELLAAPAKQREEEGVMEDAMDAIFHSNQKAMD